MILRLFDAEAQLGFYLPQMKNAPLTFSDVSEFPPRSARLAVTHARCDLRGCNLDFLFRYEIFPRSILKFFGEWQLAGRSMRAGDTIVQQAQVPAGCGPHFIFGVRVLSVFREANRAGFKYGTLAGHPEIGTNEFAFCASDAGIVATVSTTAGLASPLARFLAPLTRQYVNYCNRQALRTMAAKF